MRRRACGPGGRGGRARCARYVDEVLAILPFEPAAFARLDGPHCTYVGHPLAERIGELRPSAEEARRRLADPPLVLVLPGSRRGEIRRFAATFGAAIAQAAATAGPFDLVLPTLPHIAPLARAATADWPVRPRIVVEAAEKHAAFRIARAALAKSGTVTLELALAQVPTVAAYRIAAWEVPIYRRLVRVSSVILANLVIGENVVPELLQEDFMPKLIADRLIPLVGDTPSGAASSKDLRASMPDGDRRRAAEPEGRARGARCGGARPRVAGSAHLWRKPRLDRSGGWFADKNMRYAKVRHIGNVSPRTVTPILPVDPIAARICQNVTRSGCGRWGKWDVLIAACRGPLRA